MAFIYHITDEKKKFSFDGKLYRTPCIITVNNVVKIKRLRTALEKSGIKNVKVEQDTKRKRLSKTIPLNVGDGAVRLGSFIRN